MNGTRHGKAELQSDPEAVIARFEQAWRPRPVVDLRGLVSGLSQDVSQATLAELVRIDIEFREQQDCLLPLDEYFAVLPEIHESRLLRSEVAFEDYRVRWARFRRMPQGTPPHSRETYSRLYDIDSAQWPDWSAAQSVDVVPDLAAVSTRLEKPSAVRLPSVGDSFCGFQLIGLLGAGACGRVFLARQDDLSDRLVSLKVTSQRSRESVYLAKMQHTGIVPIYSVHKEEECQAICMPFLGVATLKDMVEDAFGSRPAQSHSTAHGIYHALLSTVNERRATALLDTIPDEQERESARRLTYHDGSATARSPQDDRNWKDAVLEIAEAVAGGLAHAHEKGVVHGDIKPANILLTDDGQPVILDFHLSRTTLVESDRNQWVGGTLPYMAPEAIEGFRDQRDCATSQTDIWSMGVLIYELFSGQLPWSFDVKGDFDPDWSLWLNQIRDRTPQRPFEMPGALNGDLARIVSKCLDPDPAGRYQNARELHVDLSHQRRHLTPPFAGSSGIVQRLAKFRKRHQTALSITSLTVVGVTLIAILAAFLVASSWQLAAESAGREHQSLLEQARGSEAMLSLWSDQAAAWDKAIEEADQLQARWSLQSPQDLAAAQRHQLLSPSQQAMERRIARIQHFWEAEAWRRKALATVDPESRTDYLQRARNAHATAIEFLGDTPDSPALDLQQGLLERDSSGTGAPADTIDVSKILSMSSGDASDYLMAAWLLQDQSPSWRLAREALAASPSNHSAWVVAGNVLIELGRVEEAIALYEVVVARQPDLAAGHYFLGRAEMDRRNYVKADAAFDTVLALEPDDLGALLNRGQCRIALGDAAGAEADFSAAIDLGIRDTRVWYLRAQVRRQLGDAEGAAEDYRYFMETEPLDAISMITRGAALVASDPVKAARDFEHARVLNPHSTEAIQNLAHIHSEINKDLPAAIGLMTELIDMQPDVAVHVATRGVLLARDGQFDAARTDAESALALSQSADTRYRVAGIYAQTSRDRASDSLLAVRLLAEAALESPMMVAGYLGRDPDIEPIADLAEFEVFKSSLGSLLKMARPAQTGSTQAK